MSGDCQCYLHGHLNCALHAPRHAYVHQAPSGREARVHRMPPGPDRWKERSRTFLGIAEAMAEQWGDPNAAHVQMEFPR